MPSNKDRLYIALYARGGAPKMPGGEDKYHWALLVGPKAENETIRGTRYHAKDGPQIPNQKKWSYEERDTSMMATNALLVRVLVAKVIDVAWVATILRNVPVPQDDPKWNCVVWVRDALRSLDASTKALGTRQMEWAKVKDTALKFCEEKQAAHRFDGKGKVGSFDPAQSPTYDLLEGRDTIP